MALHADNQGHLEALAQRLTAAGIPHHVVVECDDDPEYPGHMMAIGLCPTHDRDKVGKVLSSLRLVR